MSRGSVAPFACAGLLVIVVHPMRRDGAQEPLKDVCGPLVGPALVVTAMDIAGHRDQQRLRFSVADCLSAS